MAWHGTAWLGLAGRGRARQGYTQVYSTEDNKISKGVNTMSMYITYNVTLKGISPLLMHNSGGVNPIDPINKAKKKISGKRNKTDEDYEKLARLEWESGLYLDADEKVIIPGENIEAMLIMAGKKHKLGPKCKAGIICDGDFKLTYDGPKALEKLYKDGRFTDTRVVRIMRASIMRTRPIFRVWSLDVEIMYRPDELDENQIQDILETAGGIIGLCDYRPRFGRFEIEK